MIKTQLVCLGIGLFLIGSLLFPVSASAGIGVTPTALSFGSVTVNTTSTGATVVITNGARQSITIQQIASTLPEFVVISPVLPLSIGANASASFQVVFRPDAAVAFNGSIVIKTNRKNVGGGAISVSGTGAPSSSSPTQSYLLSPSASGLAFGNSLVGSSASQAFSLTNTGTGSVTISQVAATGTGFSVTGFSGAVNLSAGQSLPLTAKFSPLATGAVSGSISVVSTATNSPAVVSLSGTGVQPQITVIPSSISFGNVTVGVTNTQTLTIRNPGTATLSVTQASLAGTGFSVSGLALPLSVAPGGSASFNVGFAPASANTLSGSVTLISNTPNSPLVIPFSGTGISSILQLSVSPASLAFGNLATGSSTSQSITISNTGNSSVSISQITASGTGFTTSSMALPLSLAAGQSTSFNVTFAPASTGNLAGSVTVVSNAANSPLAVALSGTGATPVSYTVALNWTPGGSTYSGFNVYRGTVSGGPYNKVDSSAIPTTSYTDTGVTSGQTYYYVATELDSTGTESGYSSEVSATIP
ncbi:MAG TPA: choice-of-anchor D domain-containing protein [Candidatus Acidoferrum sp.]|nr:choice-of-anchor D domain-containing protein [Candidatus Acidoferrum sp.]